MSSESHDSRISITSCAHLYNVPELIPIPESGMSNITLLTKYDNWTPDTSPQFFIWDTLCSHYAGRVAMLMYTIDVEGVCLLVVFLSIGHPYGDAVMHSADTRVASGRSRAICYSQDSYN